MSFTMSAEARRSLLILGAVIGFSSTAHAEDEGRALEIGLRAGLGVPFGKVDGSVGDTLSRTVAFAVPLGVEVGYRLDSTLLLGVYGSYAFAAPASDLHDNCTSRGVHCSTDDVRFGVEVQIHGSPLSRWDPWFGLGSGYEWIRIDTDSSRLTASGWEVLRVDAGLDLRPVGVAALGPFVGCAVGQYNSETLAAGGSVAVANKAFHEWLMFGLRGVADIGGNRSTRTNPSAP